MARTIWANGEIKLDYGEIRVLLYGPGGETSDDIQRRARAVQRRAQTKAPSRTGQLRSSIRVNTRYPSDGADTEITADAPHALVIELGRKRVEPVNKKFLHWTGDFGPVFSKSSRAVAGVHYMEEALDAADD